MPVLLQPSQRPHPSTPLWLAKSRTTIPSAARSCCRCIASASATRRLIPAPNCIISRRFILRRKRAPPSSGPSSAAALALLALPGPLALPPLLSYAPHPPVPVARVGHRNASVGRSPLSGREYLPSLARCCMALGGCPLLPLLVSSPGRARRRGRGSISAASPLPVPPLARRTSAIWHRRPSRGMPRCLGLVGAGLRRETQGSGAPSLWGPSRHRWRPRSCQRAPSSMMMRSLNPALRPTCCPTRPRRPCRRPSSAPHPR